ncbi:PREDICTED: uncharacterized protein LOC18585796 [Theobroma cacao]|uniref:Uncharacterized protein LOC18585796 n=1 Tax=Theobroma cacao TaxID=3641 RepID=A0AB32WZX0_THECC|nr:PREDICTED: uncharacterized protein LOC18585796 [Theobroma cacao]
MELLQHFSHEHLLIFNEEQSHESEKQADCSACGDLVLGPSFSCEECGFYLDKKCVEAPSQLNHPLHRKHCLDLRARPPYEDQHPFIRFRIRFPFICDACGSSGNHVSYICSTCEIIVHRSCISLPRILRHPWHFEHPISHTYFVGQDKFKSWECRICHLEDVNSKYGSYSCSDCDYIVHVNCAIEEYNWYDFDESGIIDESLEENSALQPYSFVKEIKDGENVVAIEIKHFSHQHNLILSNDIKDDKCCDGCVLSISTSYYYCSQCNFFLHKSCSELPRKKHLWDHRHHGKPLSLTSEFIFQCVICKYETSGFAYTCAICEEYLCLRCALVFDNPRCHGHEHPLSLSRVDQGWCNACGDSTKPAFRCNSCNFYWHGNCLKLQYKARHKSDVHHFTLTYHDNDYSESHYCDICEEKRNPNHWFYYCAIMTTQLIPNVCLENTHLSSSGATT